MIRGHKGVDWGALLQAEDLPFLSVRIDPNGWYPMATFERLGNAILAKVALADMQAVRMWGRLSTDVLAHANPALLVVGDPVETLQRFRVLRASYFNFDALEIPMLTDDSARVMIHYYMGMPAEEAASWQTMGFFERLVELAGGADVHASFLVRSWLGQPCTLVELLWKLEHRHRPG
jgi:hypothetical protein